MFNIHTVNYAEILFIVLAAALGAFLAFLLNRHRTARIEKEQFKSYITGLLSEIENNIKTVEEGESVTPISFEVAEFVLGSPIFYKFCREKLGKNFLDKFWDVISSLKRIQKETRWQSLSLDRFEESEDFKELKEIQRKLKSLIKEGGEI